MASLKKDVHDSEQALFNPNCITKNLLEDIKRRCQCDKDVTVDLSDELGNVQNLIEHGRKYANDVLKPRGTFVLIRVEKKEGSESPLYTPMLNNIEVVTSSFRERLSRPESNASQRNSESRQRRKSSGSSWSKAKASVLMASGSSKSRKASRNEKRVQISRENGKLGMTL
ncbi:uncharacterized protein LOC116293916 [Actinia tenebrosa]|uniref:Uncharacterized protein LOC116293916 n=1 Tax=Actinia tenebrosa TaxID=6105 RepID=A0A6P8HQ95_ACTTE|nr:uncharacterized protein LOC116293916 [Actinia tenebrosa]